MRIVWLLAFVLGIGVSTLARAEGRVALVVGNGAYTHIQPIASARKSAEIVGKALETLGYDVTYALDQPRSEFSDTINRFASDIDEKAATVAVFYFVGYAVQHDGQNYLLPANTAAAEGVAAVPDGLRLDEVLQLLSLNSASRIILLDPLQPTGIYTVQRGLASYEPPMETFVAMSTLPGLAALDPTGTTTVFAETLTGLLPTLGLTAEDLGKRVRNEVMQATVGQQVPWTAGSLTNPLEMKNPDAGPAVEPQAPAVEAPADPADDAMWDTVKDQGSAFLRHYLQFYPAGRHAGEARQLLGEPLPEEQAVLPGAPAREITPGGGDGFDPVDETDGAIGSPLPAETNDVVGDAFPLPAPAPVPEMLPAPEPVPEPFPRDSLGWLDSPSGGGGADCCASGSSGGYGEGGYIGGGGGGGSGGSFEDPSTAFPEDEPPTAVPPGEPESPTSEMAETNPEISMWLQVYAEDSLSGYQNYLAIYPNGTFAGYAQMRVTDLTEVMSAPVAGDEPPAAANGSGGGETVASGSPLPSDEEEEIAPGSGIDVPMTDVAPVPPPAPGERAGEATIARHPTIDAPDKALAGETLTVSVALTEEQFTPEVVAKAAPGGLLAASGALQLPLPETVDEWPIDIDLLASGFDLVDGGKWSRRVMLHRTGDSDFARFEMKARAAGGAVKERKFMVRLYHKGKFLGSASRAVTVFPNAEMLEASNAPAAETTMLAAMPSQDLSTEILIGDAVEVPDLDVTIHYDDPDNLGEGVIVVHSPHIGAPESAAFSTPPGTTAWLNSEYQRLVQLGLNLRGATSLTATPTADVESQKRFVTKAAEGFGAELYRSQVPDEFKRVFNTLRAQGKLHSIQITSNSPIIPWELVRPDDDAGLPGGFLGIDYRLARWAPRESGGQVDRPLNRMAFSGVATVAPAYDGIRELPFQQIEVDALSKLAGFRLIGGDFLSFEKMVGEVSTGFIHFSGHGEVNDLGTGSPVFAIRLLDQALDPATWRALSFAPHDKGNPFYFFNACDTGRTASLGGFVQGWGPAVLSSGASGFIGGMWPLTDRTAAAFSTGFYNGISERLVSGPVYVAEVLQGVRKQFYETGDPTYLAYTFYGNANLQVVPQ